MRYWGAPLSAHLLELFDAAVAAHGDKIALVESDGNKVTFNELATRAEVFANQWAARGLKKGDQVLIAMPVAANLYASLAALWRLGVTAILPEPSMGLAGLRYAVAATECHGLVASGRYKWIKLLLPQLWLKSLYCPESARDSALESGIKSASGNNKSAPTTETGNDHTALISFTSGSTGKPKAIARSHAFLAAQRQAIAPLLKSDLAEIDLVAFPVFVLINLAEGRTSVLPNWTLKNLEALAPEQLAQWMKTHQVSRALLPPSVCEKLAQTTSLSNLSTVFTGGGPVFLDLAEKLQNNHTELRLVAVYGSTEAEPIAHIDFSYVTAEDKQAMSSGAGLLAGYPVPEVELLIVDDEILVAGAHVNRGYLDASQNGQTKLLVDDTVYHRTGDAGRLDDLGRIWLLGRHGKAINNLYPFAVESAVRLWPGVKNAALADVQGKVLLAVEGNARYLHEWQRNAAAQFDINDVRYVKHIPLDKRHRSKIDYTKLVNDLG